MPSLLKKLSYFDPYTGDPVIAAGSVFHWKQGKKSPQNSKVTQLVKQYGWKLSDGNDVWLRFRKNGNPCELFVVRGSKRWFYDLPGRNILRASVKGEGLEDLRYMLDNHVLDVTPAKAAAGAATVVNNAGNGHSEVDGDPLPELHIFGSKLLQARETMYDDAGALTGLRSRPDYGESDSYTTETNDANSKDASTEKAYCPKCKKSTPHEKHGGVKRCATCGASGKTIQDRAKNACLVLTGGIKTASGTKRANLYVTAVQYERGQAFKLADFDLSPDPSQAKVFMRRTAENLQKQIRRFGAAARIKLAEESSLNGFSIMSLEDFVSDQESGEKFAASPAIDLGNHAPIGPVVNRDKPATEREFGLGSKHREMSDEEMKEYMERLENRGEYEADKEKNKGKGKKTDEAKAEAKVEEERVKAERQKDKYSLPILHRGNIHIVNENGKEYDIDRLKNDIMKRPDRLLKKNEKMEHSGGSKQYYNIGLAALKGLAVNEKTGKFVVVDTCPGAGICKTYCYALRGNYIRVPATSLYQSRILNFLVNQPEKFKNMLKAEISLAESKSDEDTKVVIRWHDAGDFFSPQYMELAFDVARSFPDVEFYAYTKVGDVANAEKPANFIINFSEGALPGETKKVDLTQIKSSITVPQKRFWDLIVTKGAHTVKNEDGQVHFKSEEAWSQFKDRLVEDYKIKKDSLLFYNEYMEKKAEDELGDKPRWNVVVPPGGGDDAANDPTVIGSYLMWH